MKRRCCGVGRASSAALAGILGALLAIPVAGMIQVILRDVRDHRAGRPKPEPTVGEERRPVLADGHGAQK